MGESREHAAENAHYAFLTTENVQCCGRKTLNDLKEPQTFIRAAFKAQTY